MLVASMPSEQTFMTCTWNGTSFSGIISLMRGEQKLVLAKTAYLQYVERLIIIIG